MKKYLLSIAAYAAVVCSAIAGPNDFIFMQRNSADSGNIQRVIASPSSTGFFTYNTTTNLGGYTTIGNGLTLNNGVLSATLVPGPQGPAGNDGATGATGAAGVAGAAGASAYQIAVQGGYAGTQAQWLNSLVGATGSQGQAGKDGASITGPAGPSGAAGSAGANGASAYQVAVQSGYSGTQSQWLNSLIGATGAQGPAGTTAWSGITVKPTTVDGFGITDAVTTNALNAVLGSYATTSAMNTALSSYATTNSVTSALAQKYAQPTGSPSQYLRGDGSVGTLDAYPASSNPAGYATASSARAAISVTTSGNGAASYNASTGVLTIPAPPVVRMRAQTNTSGVYTWTFATPFASGVVPIVEATVEDSSGVLWTKAVSNVTNTGVTVTVTRITSVVVAGVTVLAPATASPVYVHLIATAP